MQTTKSAQVLRNVTRQKVSLVVKAVFVSVKITLSIGMKNRHLVVS